ncbi:MAG: hypothetical protein ACPGXY_04265 [Alphaproteobacteria bacterium]
MSIRNSIVFGISLLALSANVQATEDIEATTSTQTTVAAIPEFDIKEVKFEDLDHKVRKPFMYVATHPEKPDHQITLLGTCHSVAYNDLQDLLKETGHQQAFEQNILNADHFITESNLAVSHRNAFAPYSSYTLEQLKEQGLVFGNWSPYRL